jgi:hypothetical protein
MNATVEFRLRLLAPHEVQQRPPYEPTLMSHWPVDGTTCPMLLEYRHVIDGGGTVGILYREWAEVPIARQR